MSIRQLLDLGQRAASTLSAQAGTMGIRFRFAGRWLIDTLTLAVLGFAVFQLVRPGAPLHARFESRRMDAATTETARRLWLTLSGASSPLVGDAADVDVVEVLDYQCPFCRATEPAVDSALQRGVRVAVLQLPLRIHPLAEPAARAVLCAEQFGAFRTMHERLMRTTDWQRDTNWSREAGLAGLPDISAFETCLVSDAVKTRLAKQLELVDSLRLVGTPTFLSRQGVRKGVVSTRDLEVLAGRR